jgi:outer membrane biosynthesis protein TonB
MPRSSRSLFAVGLAAAAILLAACGGEDAKLLPGETAREITANLDTVKQLADEGDCVGAESAAGQVSEQVEELSGIDSKLKRALEEGAARLNEVIAGCEEASSEETAPAETTTEAEGEEEEEEKANKKKKKQQQQQESQPKQEEPTTAPEPETTPPSTTPTQPPGSNEGGGGGSGGGGEAEESPSGGVGPGTPVE